MSKIKLYNKGKRKIYYTKENHHIAPEESVAFEPEMAAKLKALYPHELLSLDDVRDQFEKKDVIPVDQAIKERNEAIAAAVKEALAEERARIAGGDESDKSKEDAGESEEEIMKKLEAEEEVSKKDTKKKK